jgi:hypothetical protein
VLEVSHQDQEKAAVLVFSSVILTITIFTMNNIFKRKFLIVLILSALSGIVLGKIFFEIYDHLIQKDLRLRCLEEKVMQLEKCEVWEYYPLEEKRQLCTGEELPFAYEIETLE